MPSTKVSGLVMSMIGSVAVMVMVSVATFDWHSVRWSTLKRMPKSETAVMLVTVAVTVAAAGLQLRDICLEVTETALASDLRACRTVLEELRRLWPGVTAVASTMTRPAPPSCATRSARPA